MISRLVLALTLAFFIRLLNQTITAVRLRIPITIRTPTSSTGQLPKDRYINSTARLLVMIIIFAMIGCSLFRDAAPEYFSTPLDAVYSTFRIFTGEGWHDIPDTVASSMGGAWGHVIRLYFCVVLLLGCIIGMSLLNSVFVDAMVSDKNDDLDEKLASIEKELKEIKSRL